MAVIDTDPFARSRLRRSGIWLWLACLVAGAMAAMVLAAPQILDQYTSGWA
jgi:hypothetical protein